jgi:hypothetical protein
MSTMVFRNRRDVVKVGCMGVQARGHDKWLSGGDAATGVNFLDDPHST